VATPIDFEPLTREAVLACLRTQSLGRGLQILEETTSTNSEAANLAQLGIEHGTVVVAERQTEGKGRLGRTWHSPAGGNLYCSVILKASTPRNQPPAGLSLIPLVAAVAIARAVQTVTALQPMVKWPNDLLVRQRKVGGVLCESGVAGRQHLYVIVGIGLNVNVPRERFPEALREGATSLLSEAGHSVDRAALLASLLFELEQRVDGLLDNLNDMPSPLLDEYTGLCCTLGQKVRVTLADGGYVEGMAERIVMDGSLRIVRDQASGGGRVDVHAGDVVHLR
jgi:BirA family biotin operon repressor/biotin-[acetyl-CoA-carboxylase] ligase